MREKGGQVWSMDLIIGVLIFLLAIGVIYTIMANKSTADTTMLKLESEVVATKLTSDPEIKVTTEGDRLAMDELFTFAQQAEQNYTELKNRLGIRDEFCIYLVDDAGNLVYITNGTRKYPGIGSGTGEINLTNGTEPVIPCGRPCPTGQCGS